MLSKTPLAFMALALASSAVVAQEQPEPGSGNIPAPDLFDSQIVCSGNLPGMRPTPTVAAQGAARSALDAAIGMGDVRIVSPTLLNDLGYVIPSAGNNCGGGTGATRFTAAVQGAVATDVAEGYSALLPKFTAVYGDPGDNRSTGTAGALHRARTEFEQAEADDATSEVRLEALRRALTTAQERHDAAKAEYDAVAQGPIHRAATAEWMAKAAVTRSIADYNDAVDGTLDSRTRLDAMNHDGYVPLGNGELVGNVVVIVEGMGIVNLATLRDYTNADLTNLQVATVDEDGVTDTTNSNFDAAGNLVVPMRLVNGELQSVTERTRVDTARADRDNHKIALATLKEFQAENQNLLLQPLVDEAVRRAQLESDYYEQQYNSLLADTTNQNPLTVDLPGTPQDESAPYSIASRYADFLAADNTRLIAETALRSAAAAREAATQTVVDQFQNPETFLAQLVARREALKTAADAAVADATDPSKALTDAAAAAAEALTEAQATQATYAAMVGDPDGPIDDLVGTLLEPGGDDGQALVDALSQTYGRTGENKEAIDALTADTEDGAEEDGPITANRKAREANAGDIETLDGRVTQNEQNIERLMGDTEEMAGMISTNAANISANAGNIVTNASFISQNAANIAHNSARIDVNEYNIAQNSGRIDANAAAIGMNSGMILDNRNMIGEINGQLDMMRAGVAASIAISRMPSIDGGLSFGAGVYGGETALAVGFALDHKRTTFDFGVTSSGGEVGAGIGVGVKIWGD